MRRNKNINFLYTNDEKKFSPEYKRNNNEKEKTNK